MKVSLLFPTWNRLEFTKEAWSALLANTSPSLVNEILAIDARSEDGTAEYMRAETRKRLPFRVRFIENNERHVVKTMRLAAAEAQSDWIAKVDSDTVVPRGWLNTCDDLLQRHPNVGALGIEAVTRRVEAPRHIRPTRHVGGIGVFRKTTWMNVEPKTFRFAGWLEHQLRSPFIKAWIEPPLPVFLLDKLPFRPWVDLRRLYAKKGWQRLWPCYKDGSAWLWKWRFPRWRRHLPPTTRR